MREKLPLAALILLACSPRPGPGPVRPVVRSPWVGGPSGELMTLSYNVAGVPFGLSRSDPARNTPLISPLLNRFDLVLIQESFGYGPELAAAVTHPHRSGPPPGVFNDGLALYSRPPFASVSRHRWRLCHGLLRHGSDCLAAKGFTVADVKLGPGAVVRVYNLHMDSGQDVNDHLARASQALQLLDEISSRSAGEAVIVGGDTNLALAADRAVLARLLREGGLTDACQALSCSDPRIDRVLFRSSEKLELRALSWSVDRSFVDARGQPLSDHEAIAVRIGWAVRGRGETGLAVRGSSAQD